MIALFASFFSLCVGPLVYQTFGPLRRTDKIVSGIILSVVAGTILLEILPNAYYDIGLYSLLLAIIGFAGPTLIERTFQNAADTTHKLTIYLGIGGLLIHALIEGAVLQGLSTTPTKGMSLAIILHRLPVGLTIWWLLRPLLGERYALLTILMMGLTTFAGYFLAQYIVVLQEFQLFAIIQSFVSGSLLHVVIYKPHADGCMHTSELHNDHEPIPNQNHDNNETEQSNHALDYKHSHNDNHDSKGAHSHSNNNSHNHTHSQSHQHNSTQHQHIQINRSSFIDKLKVTFNQIIFRWESLGLCIGLITLLIVHWHQG
ncbi:hypothetical protein [Aliikangiella maris]|uniref:Uncharacterized protein n=2 Tax=Aliikangiella maris TaxID=3162458 RepID=A0ABV3MLN0_9GAMM